MFFKFAARRGVAPAAAEHHRAAPHGQARGDGVAPEVLRLRNTLHPKATVAPADTVQTRRALRPYAHHKQED